MISLLPQPTETRQKVTCPDCNSSLFIPVITVIKDHEEVERFLAGNRNTGQCSSCQNWVTAPVRISIRLSKELLMDMDFIPIELLDDPKVLEEVSYPVKNLHRVYSIFEIESALMANLMIFRHRNDRQITLKKISIPQHVRKRIAGTYPYKTLKSIWFVSTQFEENTEYTMDEVNRKITQALSRLNPDTSLTEPSFMRSALVRLSFLTHRLNASVWQKLPDQKHQTSVTLLQRPQDT